MKSIIDIHSHILPCVDDGCGSKEEAIKMLKMYEAQGVEAVICTPHHGPCGTTKQDVNEAFEWMLTTDTNVKLFLGNEIYYTPFTLDNVRDGYANTLSGSNHILVEFDEWYYYTPAVYILRELEKMAKSEFKVILAHPERYTDLRKTLRNYKDITDMGVELQINAYDLAESDNIITRYVTRYIVENQLASYIGSDAHGARRRAPSIKKGAEWIYANCPTEYADAIVHDNAKKIIGGE